MLLALTDDRVVSRVEQVPARFWVTLLVIACLVTLIVIIIRRLASANKVLMLVIGSLVVGFVCFNWVYRRNEPKILTPFVNKIAPFFPSELDTLRNRGPR